MLSEAKKLYQQSVKGRWANVLASRRYRETEKGKLPSIRYRQSAKGKAVRARYWQLWKAKNREKAKAESQLNEAVKAGKIERKPCVQCGALKTDAHHVDYSKPFEVQWLCRSHHWQIHHIKATDIEAYQQRRTLHPKNGAT